MQVTVLLDNLICRLMNFWMFTYSRQGTTLFCESGGETPGVIYLKKDVRIRSMTRGDGIVGIVNFAGE